MNILFIDDTEQSNYVGIGGVIFHDDYLRDLFSSFKQKKAKHGIPPEEEIKWSPPSNSWIAKNLRGENRIPVYSDILGLVNSFRGKIIVAVICMDSSHQNPKEAKWKCTEFVTERFQFYLQNHEDNKGLIIADSLASWTEDRRFLQDYHRFKEEGTKYVKPWNIVMNLLTTESCLNPCLQLADLVVGITTKMCTPRRRYAPEYWDVVRHNFHRNQNGKVMGCGLKIFPNEIIGNIHATLFPEEIEESESSEESYPEYVERMRHLYGAIMDEDELDMHFPRPY
jgi:hypothetical protein